MKRIKTAALGGAFLCTLVACATNAPKSETQQNADKHTTDRVQAALSADRSLYAAHINVRADNGIVWLTGYVWDPPDVQEAASVAENVEGVKRVVNDLELQLNGEDNAPVSR